MEEILCGWRLSCWLSLRGQGLSLGRCCRGLSAVAVGGLDVSAAPVLYCKSGKHILLAHSALSEKVSDGQNLYVVLPAALHGVLLSCALLSRALVVLQPPGCSLRTPDVSH